MPGDLKHGIVNKGGRPLSLLQRAWYHTSSFVTLALVASGYYKPFSPIAEGLFLSSIPMSSRWTGDQRAIFKNVAEESGRPLQLVISAMTRQELENLWVAHAIQPAEWQEVGVEQKFIESHDMDAQFENAAVELILQRMEAVIDRGGSVDVHCKAGKGRSWTIMMCYLTTRPVTYTDEMDVRHENARLNYQEAKALIKRLRFQVNPNGTQKQFVKDFIDYHREHVAHNRDDEAEERDNGNGLGGADAKHNLAAAPAAGRRVVPLLNAKRREEEETREEERRRAALSRQGDGRQPVGRPAHKPA